MGESGFSFKVAEILNKDYFDKLNHRQKVGWFGQQIAKQYLVKKGFEILAENYYVRGGEIDLAVRQFGRVRFIEVKSRTSYERGQPQEAINFVKLERLVIAAQVFMRDKGWLGKTPFQIDGISVFISKIDKKAWLKHFENIFTNQE